jgi:hypothetical protein
MWSCFCRSGSGGNLRRCRFAGFGCAGVTEPREGFTVEIRGNVSRGYQRGPIHAGLRRTSLAPIAEPPALFNLAHQSAIALVIGRSSALAGNSPR